MTFIDELGNEFSMKPSHIKDGHWSPYVSKNFISIDYHMNELQKIVKQRGGKIKEGQTYINNRTKMIFIDQLGNEFEMQPSNVKLGKWSRYEKNCSEHICRQIIEQLYNNKFPSNYNLLTQSNGNRLQLDGYCENLNIGFEYQGQQHFVGWGNTPEKKLKSLIEIQRRDKEKEIKCKEKNILLLKINFYQNLQNIQSLIEQTFNDVKLSYLNLNLEIPLFLLNFPLNTIKIDLTKISNLVKMYNELEVIVMNKGGKIKDGEVYINNATKMTFIDKFGNEFKMTPGKVKSGQWSPYESGYIFNNPNYHMEELKKIALSKGGKIKEGEMYINNMTKMTFIDKSGNEFQVRPNNIKNGRWSPYEAKSSPLYNKKQKI